MITLKPELSDLETEWTSLPMLKHVVLWGNFRSQNIKYLILKETDGDKMVLIISLKMIFFSFLHKEILDCNKTLNVLLWVLF